MIKIEGIEIEQKRFPDGTLHAEFPRISFASPYVYIDWLYENDAELFTLICARNHYAGKKVRLYMPYVPHARMDRVKNDKDVFTLKYFCQTINSLNFDSVTIHDPHSNVAPALLNNVTVLTPERDVKDVIQRLKKEDLVMFYPDDGAMKRYEGMLDLPYAYGIKKRNWETGRIESLEVANGNLIEGKPVLIVDDICSYGGTFARASKVLKRLGASEIYLYVTHCENNILKGDIFKENIIDKVFTTKSIFTEEHEKIAVL